MSEATVEQHLPFHQQLKRERELHNLSQEELAARVGTDPKTVSRWESGERLPRSDSREALCKLFGKNAEEFGLLEAEARRQARLRATGSKSVRYSSQKEGLVEAPSVKTFYGRDQERAELEQWIVGDACRVVAVLGIGGIGKSTLASRLVEQIEGAFDYIFWASLQNAPPPRQVINKCLQFVSAEHPTRVPEGVDDQISVLLSSLQGQRCLLILDNVESILQPHQRAGQYREGYEHYGKLIKLLGEAQHQSCLLLTSREKPGEVAHQEGKSAPVRSLHVTGMRQEEGRQLLHDKDLTGSDEQWMQLIDVYGGNPLALKIVSEPIQEVFGGDIGAFLQVGEMAFGDIHDLLEQQFHRLSTWEQEILYWLAIEREALSLDELRANMLHPASRDALLDDRKARLRTLHSSACHYGICYREACRASLPGLRRGNVRDLDALCFHESANPRLCAREPNPPHCWPHRRAITRDAGEGGDKREAAAHAGQRAPGTLSASELCRRKRAQPADSLRMGLA